MDEPDNGTRADDLTRIARIGTKIAKRLNEAGIVTYAELASRSAEEIMALLPDLAGLLPLTRIDGWRQEATKLAAAQAPPESPPAPDGDDQHYQSFLVRVLLNKDGSVRRTTVRHVGTGAERHWAGLGADSLPDFIRDIAAASTTAPDPAPAADAPPAATTADQEDRAEPAATRSAPFVSSATLSVEHATLRASEPFTMMMTIDLAGASTAAGRLSYKAVIVAKPLGSGPKRTVAQSDGLVATTAPTINIDAAGLPAGAYRLDGAISLLEPGGGRPLGLAAIAEGLLVRVLPA